MFPKWHRTIETVQGKITLYWHTDRGEWSATIRTKKYLYSGIGETALKALTIAKRQKRWLEATTFGETWKHYERYKEIAKGS